MIQMQTRLDVADNTGAKEVMCFKVLGGSASHYKRRVAGLGDVIIASVKKASPGGDVKAGDVVRCVVVRVRSSTRRIDGSYVKFDRNAVVLIDNEKNPSRDPNLRRDRPGASRPPVHEDHQPGLRGGLTYPARPFPATRNLATSLAMHIRKDDQVEVITGDDKGSPSRPDDRQGAPRPPREEQDPRRGGQPGLQAPQAQRQESAGGPALQGDADRRLQRHALLPGCNRGVRVGHRFTDEGRKQRYCKSCSARRPRPGQASPGRSNRQG